MPLVFEYAAALQDEHTFKENISGGLALENLAVGWGFSDSMLLGWKSMLYSLQTLSIGLGASLSEEALGGLYKLCPHLKHLSLSLQVLQFLLLFFPFLCKIFLFPYSSSSLVTDHLNVNFLMYSLENWNILSHEFFI